MLPLWAVARRAEWRGDIQSGAVCVKTVSREESEPSPASPASRQSLTRPSTITKRQFTDANYQSDNFKSAPSGRAPPTTNNVPTQLPPAPPPGLPAAPGCAGRPTAGASGGRRGSLAPRQWTAAEAISGVPATHKGAGVWMAGGASASETGGGDAPTWAARHTAGVAARGEGARGGGEGWRPWRQRQECAVWTSVIDR